LQSLYVQVQFKISVKVIYGKEAQRTLFFYDLSFINGCWSSNAIHVV
jgi:hypothetical protein